jgi:hypothetical protein
MADIVAMAAYRAAHKRSNPVRQTDLLSANGPATLLLFTGVRQEPIGAGLRSGSDDPSRPVHRRSKAPVTDH